MTKRPNYYKATANYQKMLENVRIMHREFERTQPSSDQLTEWEMNTIHYNRTFKELPKVDQARVVAYNQALHDRFVEEQMTHGFYHNGKFYSTRSTEEDYYQRNGLSPELVVELLQIVPSGFYYHGGKEYSVHDPKKKG